MSVRWTTPIAMLLVVSSIPNLQAQAPRIRDSAGVRIVENAARSSRAVNLRLDEKVLYDVGGPDEQNPDNEFAPGAGYLRGALLGNGGMAVIDVVRIQFFGANGNRVAMVGQKGAGPADFRYQTAVCRTRGDTIASFDSQNRRVGIVTVKGVVRTVPTGAAGSAPFDFCLADGTFLLLKTTGDGAPATVTRMRTDGTVAGAIGNLTVAPIDMATIAGPTVVGGIDRIYFGNGIQNEVQVYSPEGKLTMLIRNADIARAISDAEREQHLSSTIPTNVSAADRTARMEAMRSRSTTKNWPAYGRLHVDQDGRLWVEDYRTEYPSPDAWTAFDRNGIMIGRLVIPAAPKGSRSPEVVNFGSGTIITKTYDADGGMHLVVQRILGLDRNEH